MNFLRQTNVARAREDFKTYDNAGVLYFTTAAAGELGELCNLIKKLERAKVGGPDIGHTSKLKDITPEKLEDEFGGLLIYIDLLASFFNVDLDAAIIKTFNRVSAEIGSDKLLPTG